MLTEHQTALDVWLHDVLTQEFGAADGEAVPEELLQLLPQDEDGGAS